MWSRALGGQRCILRMLALGGVLTLTVWQAATAFALPHPSALGSIHINPSSGPVGTSVTIGIILSPTNATQYIVSATTADPAQGGCSSAQPVPGVAPVTVGSQGGGTIFAWPSALNGGPYWLCASSQSGTGDTAQSQSPFTVTTGTAATATPVHGGGGTGSASAAVLPPSGGAFPGATVNIIVTGWATSDNAPPSTVQLIDYSGATQPASVPFTVAANPSPGDFTLKVTLPSSLALGKYAFELGSAYSFQMQDFTVAAPVTPTASPGPHGPARGGSSPDGSRASLAVSAATSPRTPIRVTPPTAIRRDRHGETTRATCARSARGPRRPRSGRSPGAEASLLYHAGRLAN